MNLEHKEKQLVFDEYARSQGLLSWNHIINAYAFDVAEADMNNAINCLESFMVHVHNATDLVQKKALERASENITMKLKENYTELSLMDDWMGVDKESITNENNLIK